MSTHFLRRDLAERGAAFTEALRVAYERILRERARRATEARDDLDVVGAVS